MKTDTFEPGVRDYESAALRFQAARAEINLRIVLQNLMLMPSRGSKLNRPASLLGAMWWLSTKGLLIGSQLVVACTAAIVAPDVPSMWGIAAFASGSVVTTAFITHHPPILGKC